jgi:hypothetical protein
MRRAVIFSLIFLMPTVTVLESANAKSRSYKLGYKWATETDTNTLIGYSIKRVFNLNGRPIKSKAKSWCDDMTGWQHYSRENPESKSDWIKGCVAGVMTYTIRRP